MHKLQPFDKFRQLLLKEIENFEKLSKGEASHTPAAARQKMLDGIKFEIEKNLTAINNLRKDESLDKSLFGLPSGTPTDTEVKRENAIPMKSVFEILASNQVAKAESLEKMGMAHMMRVGTKGAEAQQMNQATAVQSPAPRTTGVPSKLKMSHGDYAISKNGDGSLSLLYSKKYKSPVLSFLFGNKPKEIGKFAHRAEAYQNLLGHHDQVNAGLIKDEELDKSGVDPAALRSEFMKQGIVQKPRISVPMASNKPQSVFHVLAGAKPQLTTEQKQQALLARNTPAAPAPFKPEPGSSYSMSQGKAPIWKKEESGKMPEIDQSTTSTLEPVLSQAVVPDKAPNNREENQDDPKTTGSGGQIKKDGPVSDLSKQDVTGVVAPQPAATPDTKVSSPMGAQRQQMGGQKPIQLNRPLPKITAAVPKPVDPKLMGYTTLLSNPAAMNMPSRAQQLADIDSRQRQDEIAHGINQFMQKKAISMDKPAPSPISAMAGEAKRVAALPTRQQAKGIKFNKEELVKEMESMDKWKHDCNKSSCGPDCKKK